MKKFLLFLLILIFVLSGCVRIEIRNPEEQSNELSAIEPIFADSRSFALSEDAASAALSLAENGAENAEICAYYDDIVTYKITYDNFAEFYNFKILSENGYSLEFISKRAADGSLCGFCDMCEFYPTAADGYPEKALVPVSFWELPDINIEKPALPAKAKYTVTTVGSAQIFTESEHIEKICSAAEQVKILPVERFLTDYESLLTIDSASNTLEYFANADDENPLYTLYFELFRIDINGEKGRMYYAFDDISFKDNFNEVYFGLINQIVEETFHPFSVSAIGGDFVLGHTGDACFSGGKLWISAYTYSAEDTSSFIADRQFIFDLGADSFTFIDLDENDENHSHSYTDDFDGNMYHLVAENIDDETNTSEYILYSLDEGGAVIGSRVLSLDGFGISHITNDLNGNWYIDCGGNIHIFDRDFNEIFHADYSDIYLSPLVNLFRLPDGRVCAVFEKEIDIFDPEDFGFCESYELSKGAIHVFPGNSEYDVIYTDIGNSVYGIDFGKEPEFIIMLDKTANEYALMQLYMDENGDIYTVGNTDKLRHGATEIYKFEISK